MSAVSRGVQAGINFVNNAARLGFIPVRIATHFALQSGRYGNYLRNKYNAYYKCLNEDNNDKDECDKKAKEFEDEWDKYSKNPQYYHPMYQEISGKGELQSKNMIWKIDEDGNGSWKPADIDLPNGRFGFGNNGGKGKKNANKSKKTKSKKPKKGTKKSKKPKKGTKKSKK